MDDSVLLEIYDAAMNVFCKGIYVPCDRHPCGWDFISFEWIDNNTYEDSIFCYSFDIGDISDGTYDIHPYERMTLKEILKETKGDYCFEIGQIDW